MANKWQKTFYTSQTCVVWLKWGKLLFIGFSRKLFLLSTASPGVRIHPKWKGTFSAPLLCGLQFKTPVPYVSEGLSHNTGWFKQERKSPERYWTSHNLREVTNQAGIYTQTSGGTLALLLPLGAATFTCTPCPWTWVIVARDTDCLCVSKQLPHSVLLGSFFAQLTGAVPLPWLQERLRKAFLVFSASSLTLSYKAADSLVTTGGSQDGKAETNQWFCLRGGPFTTCRRELRVGVDFAPKWACQHLVCANGD